MIQLSDFWKKWSKQEFERASKGRGSLGMAKTANDVAVALELEERTGVEHCKTCLKPVTSCFCRKRMT